MSSYLLGVIWYIYSKMNWLKKKLSALFNLFMRLYHHHQENKWLNLVCYIWDIHKKDQDKKYLWYTSKFIFIYIYAHFFIMITFLRTVTTEKVMLCRLYNNSKVYHNLHGTHVIYANSWVIPGAPHTIRNYWRP